MNPVPLVILGGGYLGTRLFHQATAEGWSAYCTSRHPHQHLTDIPPHFRLRFDLSRPDTWKTLPAPLSLIWCFPACPLSTVKVFLEALDALPIRMVVIGSTSAYPSTGTVITEQDPPNGQLPRVQGEEFLRTEYGAIIIRLAGLYGPGRNVLDWIRRKKVSHTPRLVNLLHIEDAVGICLAALLRAPQQSTYVASDGTPRKWSDIFTYASKTWHINIPPLTQARDPGKYIDNYKLRTELQYDFRFPDLYEALDQIESKVPAP